VEIRHEGERFQERLGGLDQPAAGHWPSIWRGGPWEPNCRGPFWLRYTRRRACRPKTCLGRSACGRSKWFREECTRMHPG
jgi:hypothetical protein